MENLTTKYQLIAVQATDYSLDNGWRMADTIYDSSEIFNTEDEALSFQDEFVSSLKISTYEVYEISMNEVIVELDEYGDDKIEIINSESLEIVDGSADEGNNFQYILTQEFGQYMIPKGVYHIDYARHNLTRNGWTLRTENQSFRASVMDVFKTEEEVKDYIEENNIYVKTSVIEIENI